jgi:hypothetical protein
MWTGLTVPMNHGWAVVFGSVKDRWPLKPTRLPEFILVDESDHGSSTRGYDEYEQGMEVLTNSRRRQRDGLDGPATRSRGSGARSSSTRCYG